MDVCPVFRASAHLTQLVLVAVALAGCSVSVVTESISDDESTRDDAGAIVEAGTVGVRALEEGDCLLLGELLQASDESPEAVSFEGVPCADEHDGEVILVDEDFYSRQTEYPGQDQLYAEADLACTEVLEDYTQEPYATSPYLGVSISPNETSWASEDDRRLVCIGVTLNEDLTEVITTTGSIGAE